MGSELQQKLALIVYSYLFQIDLTVITYTNIISAALYVLIIEVDKVKLKGIPFVLR
jgi:diphthamide synthase (EF-2-diphthine--ammonia ligase)